MTRRACVATVFLVGLVAVAFVSCSSPPGPSPNDPGIPEARADATAQLDAVAARFAFSDEAIVLGEGREDSCAFGTSGWFGTPASNYRCWMQWVELVVIPAAVTREEVAAALDAELAAMDAPIAGSVVRSLVLTHPSNVSIMAIGAGGHEGDVVVGVQSEPFRPEFWPYPSVRVGGSVSESGNLDDVSVADVEATGAAQIVVVSASIEYWAEEANGLSPGSGSSPAFVVEGSAYGDNYYFDLAEGQPVEAVEVCLRDPSIAPTSVTRQQEPFARITFKLFGVAVHDDAIRVRDCLTANVSSGTLAWYEPYYRGGETPAPVPTPLPGLDPPR